METGKDNICGKNSLTDSKKCDIVDGRMEENKVLFFMLKKIKVLTHDNVYLSGGGSRAR